MEESRVELAFLLVNADHSLDEDLVGNVDVFFLDVVEVELLFRIENQVVGFAGLFGIDDWLDGLKTFHVYLMLLRLMQ